MGAEPICCCYQIPDLMTAEFYPTLLGTYTILTDSIDFSSPFINSCANTQGRGGGGKPCSLYAANLFVY